MLSFTKKKAVIVNMSMVIASIIVSFLLIGKLIPVGAKYNITSLNSRSWACNFILLCPIVSCILFVAIRKLIIPLVLKGRVYEVASTGSDLYRAIISFIFSLFGFIPLFGLVGIYFGHNAFRKIKIFSNSCATSLAIMGLFFGYLWITIYIFVILRILLGITIGELAR